MFQRRVNLQIYEKYNYGMPKGVAVVATSEFLFSARESECCMRPQSLVNTREKRQQYACLLLHRRHLCRKALYQFLQAAVMLIRCRFWLSTTEAIARALPLLAPTISPLASSSWPHASRLITERSQVNSFSARPLLFRLRTEHRICLVFH